MRILKSMCAIFKCVTEDTYFNGGMRKLNMVVFRIRHTENSIIQYKRTGDANVIILPETFRVFGNINP